MPIMTATASAAFADLPGPTPGAAPPSLEKWRCPVCLHMLCKPVVNQCGHVFCFWCVHRAMDGFSAASHCPLCRKNYNHLPDVCEVLHGYLARTFPKEYAARLRENLDEEEEGGAFSPDLPAELMISTSPIAQRGTRSATATAAGEGEVEGDRAASSVPLEGRALLDALEQQAPQAAPDPVAFRCGYSFEGSASMQMSLWLSTATATAKSPPSLRTTSAAATPPETTTATTAGARGEAIAAEDILPDDEPVPERRPEAAQPPGGVHHVLWEPLVLTCGHAICKGCYRRRLEMRSQARTKASVLRLKCPVCRRRVNVGREKGGGSLWGQGSS